MLDFFPGTGFLQGPTPAADGCRVEPHLDEPNILVLHDGELDDVSALLEELGLRAVVRRGSPPLEVLQASWELVVGTPRRLLDSDALRARGVQIAVSDEDSRTLRASLKRAGIDYAVRRPVHPAALRLLVLHALYRGPEKRRARRVSVGAPVRLRVGLRRMSGLLVDLSHSGCRILMSPGVPRGRRVQVQLGGELTGGRPLQLKGRVQRSTPASDAPPGSEQVGLSFERISSRRARQLASVVARFAEGPARWAEEDASQAALARRPATAARSAARSGGSDPAPDEVACERRLSERHEIHRHVITLERDAARVLMGRDISLGGMRVDPHPGLSVGCQMQLALHVRGREAPLVVQACVERDDGERGLVLAFRDLDEASRRYLEKMVRFLPILATRQGDGDAGVILSEILSDIVESPAA